MSLIRLEKVEMAFQGIPVLKGADLRVETGEKVGLIGRNGTGKSTLFRLITGEISPDDGVVDRMKRARIAYLAQLPEVSDTETIYDTILNQFDWFLDLERRLGDLERRMSEGDESAMEEYSTAQERFTLEGGYGFRARVKRVLCGLGFSEDEFTLPFSALSGGQRTRLMLALVLLEDADLLLLDEPENHLDLQAREWLESFLKDWPGAFVIISHDRQTLNAVTTRTVELERGRTSTYSGNYDAYMKEKAIVEERQSKARSRQQELVAREEAWINRFRYKATKAKQVQSRIKRLDKLEMIDAPTRDGKTARFSLGKVERSGQLVLGAEDLGMRYDDLVLYDELSFKVERGERVGIIGPNGSGKTTLLRHLAGHLEGGQGEVELGHKCVVGYYDQQHEGLGDNREVIQELEVAFPEMQREELRKYVGRFLFSGDDVFKKVSTLSGGERSRLAMAKLILGKANLLLLDEPTNHLDLASRESLEEALGGFAGSMVVVSHDRAFLDRLVDKLIIVSEGSAEVFLGNYSRYRWKSNGAIAEEERRGDEMKIRKKKQIKPSQDARTAGREARKDRKRLSELEDRIEAMEGLLDEFGARFEALDPSDYESLSELTKEKQGLEADLRSLYEAWEELSKEISL